MCKFSLRYAPCRRRRDFAAAQIIRAKGYVGQRMFKYETAFLLVTIEMTHIHATAHLMFLTTVLSPTSPKERNSRNVEAQGPTRPGNTSCV